VKTGNSIRSEFSMHTVDMH